MWWPYLNSALMIPTQRTLFRDNHKTLHKKERLIWGLRKLVELESTKKTQDIAPRVPFLSKQLMSDLSPAPTATTAEQKLAGHSNTEELSAQTWVPQQPYGSKPSSTLSNFWSRWWKDSNRRQLVVGEQAERLNLVNTDLAHPTGRSRSTWVKQNWKVTLVPCPHFIWRSASHIILRADCHLKCSVSWFELCSLLLSCRKASHVQKNQKILFKKMFCCFSLSHFRCTCT